MDRQAEIKKLLQKAEQTQQKDVFLPSYWTDGTISVGTGERCRKYENEPEFFNDIPNLLEEIDAVFFRGKMVENVKQWEKIKKSYYNN